MIDFSPGDLAALVTAAGALGGAAFGIVEGLKSKTAIGEIGFPVLKDQLGAVWESLRGAFGKDYESVLKGQYQGSSEELVRMLRQGVRIGLTPENATTLAEAIGASQIDANTLKSAAEKIFTGQPLDDKEKNVLARYEVAADARIDAAVALALRQYASGTRLIAMAVAFLIALLVGALSSATGQANCADKMILAFVVGIAAVPLAPIAKDVATAIQAAAQAIGKKS